MSLVEGVAIIYHSGGRSPEPSDKIATALLALGGVGSVMPMTSIWTRRLMSFFYSLLGLGKANIPGFDGGCQHNGGDDN